MSFDTVTLIVNAQQATYVPEFCRLLELSSREMSLCGKSDSDIDY